MNIKWTFVKAINQDEVTSDHFKVTKKSDGSLVKGTLTIDDTNKIVTFIPLGITKTTTYTATATAVKLLDGSGSTAAITTDFTTI